VKDRESAGRLMSTPTSPTRQIKDPDDLSFRFFVWCQDVKSLLLKGLVLNKKQSVAVWNLYCVIPQNGS